MSKGTYLGALVAALIAAAAPNAQSSKGVMPHPEVKIETVEADNQTGRVTMRVTVEVRQYVAEVGLKLEGDSAILPGGQLEYASQAVDGRKAVEFPVSFDVPPNDTVGVSFFAIEKKAPLQGQVFRDDTLTDRNGKAFVAQELVPQWDEIFRSATRYFLRVGDKLQVLNAPPRQEEGDGHVETPNAGYILQHEYEGDNPPDSDKTDSVGLDDSLHNEVSGLPFDSNMQNFTTRRGFSLDDGTFVSSENMTEEERITFGRTHKLFRRDNGEGSQRADTTHSVTVEEQWRRLRELEQDTLKETDAQTVFVDGKPYIREKGERFFREQRVITDMNAYLLERRRLREQEAETRVRILIECRDSADSVYVDRLVDSLLPSGRQNMYEAVVTPTVMDSLRKAGIRFYRVDRERKTPGAQRDTAKIVD
ncbi:MAG: hypothetical protein NTW07_03875 [candidate division Zixibacteria bacterium]|nr:hypothetical protein [candidate division Zixibacteria bacterium]